MKWQIVYATETGTAQRLAFDAKWELTRFGIEVCDVFDIREFDEGGNYNRILFPCKENDESGVIFILSTGGNGEFPWSMKPFWNWLLKEAVTFEGKRLRDFCVVGLGDRKYPLFNAAGRKLYNMLKRYRRPFFEICLADDSHEFGVLGEFDGWLRAFINEVAPNAIPKAIEVHIEEIGNSCFIVPKRNSSWRESFSKAVVIENKILTSATNPTAEVFQISFKEKQSPSLSSYYPPGSMLSVIPEIGKEDLSLLRSRCRIDFGKEEEEGFLLNDIRATPSRSFLLLLTLVLSREAKDFETHFKKLLELGAFNTPDSHMAYMEYVILENRSILDVLVDFSASLKPLDEAFFERMVPPIAPRKYSIASCSLWYRYLKAKRKLQILFPLLDVDLLSRTFAKNSLREEKENDVIIDLCVKCKTTNTKLGREIKGVCSYYLKDKKAGEEVLVKMQHGLLSSEFTKATAKRHLLIGTGTGIAPIRGLVQHLHLEKMKEVAIILGFRKKSWDYLYGFELDKLSSLNCHWFKAVAFSREEEGASYIYKHITEQGLLVKEYLRGMEGGLVIAGRSHPMPMQVCDTIGEVLGDATFLSQLKNKGLVIFDTWG